MFSCEFGEISKNFVEILYNLKSTYTSEKRRDYTVYHSSKRSKLRDLLQNSIKNSPSLKQFKTHINTRTADHCPCIICKKYVGRVGFIKVDPQVLHFEENISKVFWGCLLLPVCNAIV